MKKTLTSLLIGFTLFTGIGGTEAHAHANSNELDFVRPVKEGKVTSKFGVRTLNGITRLHAGTDIGLKIGTELYAVEDGVVTRMNNSCSNNGYFDGVSGGCFVNGKPMGFGNYIEITLKNKQKIIYSHLTKVQKGLTVGSTVKQGDVIGLSGNSGNTTGPHLHLELRNSKNQPIDSFFITQAYSYNEKMRLVLLEELNDLELDKNNIEKEVNNIANQIKELSNRMNELNTSKDEKIKEMAKLQADIQGVYAD